MASAETGSGKTAAYALPIIECLEEPAIKPRTLVLVPTRELALQVASQFRIYGRFMHLRAVTVYGGVGYDMQTRDLKRGADVIVATPGRLLDHMERRTVDLSEIEILVLDEADRLLDMGFMPQVRRVVSKLSRQRQTIMLSATIDQRVERLAAEFLNNPTTIRVNTDHIEPKEIDQKIFHVHEFKKDALLVQLLKELEMKSVLVFARTRHRAGWIKDRLAESHVDAEEIHSDIPQNQRERTLKRYREGGFAVLVATDVAARGLDIPTISHVVNYDLPDSPADYVHRIGRTGRAGRSGVALSFVSDEQRHLLKDIEKITGRVLDTEAPALLLTKSLAASRMRPQRRRRVI
jgi:ATP-dependent RNA helicase RhlE